MDKYINVLFEREYSEKKAYNAAPGRLDLLLAELACEDEIEGGMKKLDVLKTFKKIADTYKCFTDGTLEEKKGYCAVVTIEDITKQDYILTPGRYVGIEEQEEDSEPFDEKMTRLTAELYDLFSKSHDLEKQIRKKLEAIGYGE